MKWVVSSKTLGAVLHIVRNVPGRLRVMDSKAGESSVEVLDVVILARVRHCPDRAVQASSGRLLRTATLIDSCLTIGRSTREARLLVDRVINIFTIRGIRGATARRGATVSCT